MASLNRSSISFRRQGSSGLAWEENWIPAEVDGGAGGGPALPPPPGPTTNFHHHLHYSATAAQSIHQKSSSARSDPQLRHSRSVGLLGAGYSRSRDHRVQSSLIDLNPAHKETGHKSHSRVLRWFKRTFFKSKTWFHFYLYYSSCFFLCLCQTCIQDIFGWE